MTATFDCMCINCSCGFSLGIFDVPHTSPVTERKTCSDCGKRWEVKYLCKITEVPKKEVSTLMTLQDIIDKKTLH